MRSYFYLKMAKRGILKRLQLKVKKNGLCLKFNLTSSRVSQNFFGGLHLPYLETRIFKNQISPMSWGFATTFQHHIGQEVPNSLTVCLILFLKLDHGSGQVCWDLQRLVKSVPRQRQIYNQNIDAKKCVHINLKSHCTANLYLIVWLVILWNLHTQMLCFCFYIFPRSLPLGQFSWQS